MPTLWAQTRKNLPIFIIQLLHIYIYSDQQHYDGIEYRSEDAHPTDGYGYQTEYQDYITQPPEYHTNQQEQ